jgi:hypothetical protein
MGLAFHPCEQSLGVVDRLLKEWRDHLAAQTIVVIVMGQEFLLK